METRYAISPIADMQGWWEIRDNEAGITCRFEEHRMNEAQQISLDDAGEAYRRYGTDGLARLLREMGAWASAYHYNTIMPHEDMSDRLRLGRIISYHRKAKGWNIRELGEASGINPCTISQVENGKGNITLDVLFRLINALGLDFSLA